MNQRALIISIVSVLIVGGIIYYEQSAKSFIAPETRLITIGVITNPPSLDSTWNGFQFGMETLGYKEGVNIKYIVEAGGGNLDAAKVVVERLVSGPPLDALFVMGSIAGRAAKEVTEEKNPSLPVVFGVVSNPVGGKLVASMQSSGNNLTGVTPNNEVINTKRLELFLQMVPETKRVIMGWSDPNTSGVVNLRAAAQTLSVEFVDQQVEDVAALKAFYATFAYRSGDAILRASDSVSGVAIKDVIALSLDKKIPLSGTNKNDVEFGALMSYGANFNKIGEQSARLMDRVLRGIKPSDLPIELPDAIEFIVNEKTAALLDLEITNAVLLKAHSVIR